MLNVNKYVKNVMVEVKTVEKIVQKDSLENGCELSSWCIGLDFETKNTIELEKLNFETLKELVLTHYNKYFYNITENDIFGNESNLQLTINEDNDANQLTTKEELERADKRKELYLCDYITYITINGVRFDECNELFNS